METEKISLRVVMPEDAGALSDIYRPYVEKTAITFEYDVPTEEEFAARIRNTLKKYPYVAVVRGTQLLGYVYTGPFVGRAAYDWAAETSIYVREDQKRHGIGKLLYAAIEGISRMQHILNLNACIGYPEQDDEYLTGNSVEYHTHMGYRMVGEFHNCGYKFGRWYHMVWMEKMLGEHPEHPAPVIPFPDLETEEVERFLKEVTEHVYGSSL